MVMRSAMVAYSPIASLSSRLRVRARIDLALDDLRRAAHRQRGDLATQSPRARLLSVERDLRARAFEQPCGLVLRGLLRGLDDLVGAGLRLIFDLASARSRALATISATRASASARSLLAAFSAAARPSAIFWLRALHRPR